MKSSPATLDDAQISSVISATQNWCAKAEDLFAIQIADIDVRFDLRGRTSGMFCYRGKQCWIRYNPWIFAKHFEESLASTVPHEVAHYVCLLLHGHKPKPHGREWKSIMHGFGVAAETTCKLDIGDLPQKRLKRYLYGCACGTQELTSIRHNRIVRGENRYRCPKCQNILVACSSISNGL